MSKKKLPPASETTKFSQAKIVHYSSQLTLPRPFNALQIAHRIARKVCQRAPRESATALLKSDGGSIGGRRATKVAEHVATAASALLVELAEASQNFRCNRSRVFNLIFAAELDGVANDGFRHLESHAARDIMHFILVATHVAPLLPAAEDV